MQGKGHWQDSVHVMTFSSISNAFVPRAQNHDFLFFWFPIVYTIPSWIMLSWYPWPMLGVRISTKSHNVKKDRCNKVQHQANALLGFRLSGFHTVHTSRRLASHLEKKRNFHCSCWTYRAPSIKKKKQHLFIQCRWLTATMSLILDPIVSLHDHGICIRHAARTCCL